MSKAKNEEIDVAQARLDSIRQQELEDEAQKLAEEAEGSLDDKFQELDVKAAEKAKAEREELTYSLIYERARREAALSKTAREAVALFKKSEEKANKVLILDFLMGGHGTLSTQTLFIQPINLTLSCLRDGEGNTIAVRSTINPLAPFFVIQTATSVTSELVSGCRAYMKAFVVVDNAVWWYNGFVSAGHLALQIGHKDHF